MQGPLVQENKSAPIPGGKIVGGPAPAMIPSPICKSIESPERPPMEKMFCCSGTKLSGRVVVNVPRGPDQFATKAETKGQYGIGGGVVNPGILEKGLSTKLRKNETSINSVQGEGLHVLFPVIVIRPVAK
jgi:hypothetical protein